MRVTFDPAKRKRHWPNADRLADAVLVFAGVTLEMEDIRKDYGEPRIICYGLLEGRWLSWATRRVAQIATSSA